MTGLDNLMMNHIIQAGCSDGQIDNCHAEIPGSRCPWDNPLEIALRLRLRLEKLVNQYELYIRTDTHRDRLVFVDDHQHPARILATV